MHIPSCPEKLLNKAPKTATTRRSALFLNRRSILVQIYFACFHASKRFIRVQFFLNPLDFIILRCFQNKTKKNNVDSVASVQYFNPIKHYASLSERRELACFPPRDCSHRSPPLAWFRAFVQLFSLDSIMDKS